MSTWEERQSAKAQARRAAGEDDEIAQWRREFEEQQDRWVRAYALRLDPEEVARQRAEDRPDIACACIGGPYCCVIRFRAENQVLGIEEEDA